MKSLQYPGIRVQQVVDARTRAALLDVDGHLKALYDFLNSAISTEHGSGALRVVKPIVIPEVMQRPTEKSTYGRVGQLVRTGHQLQDLLYMKQGSDAEDTNWVPLPTGSTGFANPTAVIGLSAINGIATTYMRSDAAPALSQNIAPTWTAVHRHSNYVEYDEMAAPGTPAANRVRLYGKDSAGVSSLFFKKDDGTEVDLGSPLPGSVLGTGTVLRMPIWIGTSTIANSDIIGPYGGTFTAELSTINMAANRVIYLPEVGTDAILLAYHTVQPTDGLIPRFTSGGAAVEDSLWDASGGTLTSIGSTGIYYQNGSSSVTFKMGSDGLNFWLVTQALSTAAVTYDAHGGGPHQFLQNILLSGKNLQTDTGTGMKIGTATNQRVGFFNATPIVQPANTVAINDLLVNLGLRASGGVSNFTTNVDVSTKNIVTDTVTGTKIGTGATQKLGFFNATPMVQPTDGVTLTNNVTSGGSSDTIADFTDLIIYANDAAAIRNDIYQLARKMKIVVDNLRSLGLES